MRYKVNVNNKKRFFSSPCFIADDYIKLADSAALKLIIYLLSDESDSFDNDAVCKRLGISGDSLSDALIFWKERGVISEDSVEAQTSNAEAPLPALEKAVKQVWHRGYSAKEIADILDNDSATKELFHEAEQTLGRTLKHADHEMLISLKDYCGFMPPAIILILEYCRDNDKTSARYIETVARDFADKGITDFLDIDAEIKRRSEIRSFEAKVASDFGIDTKLTSKQSQFISSWQDMGFDLSMISLARERCVDATNKLSFPYINSVLKSWADKKIFTPEAAESEVKPQKTISADEEHSFDIDEFDAFTLGIKNN